MVPSVAADGTSPPATAISADALAATPAHTVKDGLASVTNLDQMTRSANMTRMTNMSHLLVGGVPSPMLPALCPNSIIPHSNRTAEAPCRDPNRPEFAGAPEGTECFFSCQKGYIPLGRHVCQWHDPKWVRNNSFYKDHDHKLMAWKVEPDHRYIFWGGRCEPLCGTKTCASTQSPRRYKKSTLVSERLSRAEDCMETECFDSGKDNLLNVAKGVYNAMQIARDEKSGNYYNAINFNWFKKYRERKNVSHAECGSDAWLKQAVRSYQDELSKNYSLDATAMGIMSEVVGSALGFQSPTEAVGKVIATLGNLTEQFSSARDSRGFYAHFYVHQKEGGASAMNTTSPLATGILVQAALFARSYFYAINAGERLRVGGAELPIDESEREGFASQVTPTLPLPLPLPLTLALPLPLPLPLLLPLPLPLPRAISASTLATQMPSAWRGSWCCRCAPA